MTNTQHVPNIAHLEHKMAHEHLQDKTKLISLIQIFGTYCLLYLADA